MEYIYAAMLLHKAKQPITEENVKKVLESAGVKVDDGRVKALIAALDGVDIEKAIKESAVPVAAPAALAEGEAKKEGLGLGVSQGEFRVEITSIEDAEVKPNKEFLQEIAFASGGEYSEPENFSLLLGNLELGEKSKLKTRVIPLWDQLWLLLFFVLFLTLEWFFRKRFQLL